MEIASVCLIVSATLTIQPDRSQFHLYESFNLTCAAPGNFNNWTVIRNASEPLEPCERWGRPNRTSCINRSTFASDSGPYWCQSKTGECSNVLNITVSYGVILESPALPVTEGENLTLRCSTKGRNHQRSSSNFTAKFFRNGVFIGEQPDGKMNLSVVSTSKGYYQCEHPKKGKSAQSWLAVRVRTQLESTSPDPPLISVTRLVFSIVLFVLYTVIFIGCVYIYRSWAQARADDVGQPSRSNRKRSNISRK